MTLPNQSPKPRRFYKVVEVAASDQGFGVRLDGRGPKTPGARPLVVPTEALARLLAAEWDAQVGEIDLDAMPATRLAYTVIDHGAGAREGMADEVARYAGSDLLCYLAADPRELAERDVLAAYRELTESGPRELTAAAVIRLAPAAPPTTACPSKPCCFSPSSAFCQPWCS